MAFAASVRCDAQTKHSLTFGQFQFQFGQSQTHVVGQDGRLEPASVGHRRRGRRRTTAARKRSTHHKRVLSQHQTTAKRRPCLAPPESSAAGARWRCRRPLFSAPARPLAADRTTRSSPIDQSLTRTAHRWRSRAEPTSSSRTSLAVVVPSPWQRIRKKSLQTRLYVSLFR